ncbi:LPD1 domain-containing protein [Anaerostipes hadrus]|uniref:LPD1 domain-containing protein n=1 Tax=Anaerostipes hadrus TaxID=649756 RepID=UPI001570D80D|nr:LPD1 domain-containing protein [Anaerostipes hadrus]
MKEIKDFGEKIGGARKDVWALRGLILDDIFKMTSGEKVKYIKRDNIWKKIDEKALLETQPRIYVYWLKQIHSCIYPDLKHIGSNEAAIEKYIKGVTAFRDYILSAANAVEAAKLNEDMLYGKIFHHSYGVYYELNDEFHGVINGRKLLKLHNKSNNSFSRLKEEMDKKGFGWTKEEFCRNDYEIHYIDGITCEIEKDYANKTYLVIRKDCSKYFYCLQDVNLPAVLINQYALLNKNSNYVIAFDENKDILESMIERLVKLRVESEAKKPKKSNSRKQKKGKWIPPQLTHLKREGKDHRHGHNVTGDDFMKCFGIRGGEFGNWTNDHDRQVNLNMAFDAFCDMADALNISRRDIGLIGLETGALAIAFGARGHSGALAHYEPEREVINLTKMKGAGSLAHEWGHALDDYIGKMSEIHRFGKLASMTLVDQKIPDCFRSVIHALCLNENHGITKYYSDSNTFGEMFNASGHGYWTSNEELFARAFACYVKDKLSGRNDYLVGHADIGKAEHQGKTIYVYPVGEERKRFDQKMDEMIQGLKEIGYLHDPIEAYEFETPKAKLHVSKEIGIKITNVHQMSFADFGI